MHTFPNSPHTMYTSPGGNLRHQEVKEIHCSRACTRTNSGGKTVQWTNMSGPSLSLSPAVNKISLCANMQIFFVSLLIVTFYKGQSSETNTSVMEF